MSSPYAFAAFSLCRNYEIKRRYRMSTLRGAVAAGAGAGGRHTTPRLRPGPAIVPHSPPPPTHIRSQCFKHSIALRNKGFPRSTYNIIFFAFCTLSPDRSEGYAHCFYVESRLMNGFRAFRRLALKDCRKIIRGGLGRSRVF